MLNKFTVLTCLLFSLHCFAQKKKEQASIEVLSFTVDKDDLRVDYKIVNGEDQTFYNVQGEFVDSGYLRHSITQATGDFGSRVLYSSGKNIYQFNCKTNTVGKGVFKVMLTAEKTQKKKERVSVEVISFTIDKYDLRVDYKIVNGEDHTFYNVQGEIVDSTYMRHSITQATGDFGSQVLYSSEKNIYQFNCKTNTVGKGVFKVMLTAEKTINYGKLGGPKKALLSLALPGLGDKYVYYKNITGPIFTTATLGLIAGGVYTKIQSRKYYNDYQDAVSQKDIDKYYDKAISQDKLGNTLLTTAATVWVIDIALVAYKGHKNKKKSTTSGNLGASSKNKLDWSIYPFRHTNTSSVAIQLKLNF